jgi:hypothetical protein
MQQRDYAVSTCRQEGKHHIHCSVHVVVPVHSTAAAQKVAPPIVKRLDVTGGGCAD